MINEELALRYAEALYKIISEKSELNQELIQAVALMDKTPNLRNLLLAPQISREDKMSMIRKFFKEPIDLHLENFLLFLLQKGRIQYLPAIAKAYKKMVEDGSNIIEAKLITTVPLDTDSKEKLRAQLEKSYGKKIEFEEIIDPQIIGGMTISIDNQMMDSSIKSRLTKLKENLLDVTV